MGADEAVRFLSLVSYLFITAYDIVVKFLRYPEKRDESVASKHEI